jgi:two-component system chemotaxis response regulator CheB
MPVPIRVLVVDDSSFMRKSIERMLTADDIQVVGTARDGIDALEKIPVLKPDIVTMDVEMPRMDGLTCLKKIMADNPLPVLMFSSLTHEGAKATLDALALGALDFVAKEKDYSAGDENVLKVQDRLREKIRGLVSTSRFRVRPAPPPPRPERAQITGPVPRVDRSAITPGKALPTHPRAEMIVLGCSTGGPKALQEFLPYLPKALPVPMLIVQHMPASFTKPFADRLNSISQVEIKEAANGDIPQAGHVYIAPGGIHMHLRGRGGRYSIELNPEPAGTLHRPSVDVMFQSAYDACDSQLISVILTGMGSDGALGMQKLKQKGAFTVAEAESSCVVYGMPKSAVELGCVDVVAPIQDMADIIRKHFQL